ncbi:MAG: hypothetical protein LBB43_04640 [Spirochaetaceae bacterium]|nr:hypothetical protein [Spirochaetaceae bacterium]
MRFALPSRSHSALYGKEKPWKDALKEHGLEQGEGKRSAAIAVIASLGISALKVSVVETLIPPPLPVGISVVSAAWKAK